MKVKGAIFDVDGTILDSMPIWESIGSRYLRHLGYEPKADLDSILNTMSVEEGALYYQSEYGVSLSKDEIVEGLNCFLADFYEQEVEIKREVRDVLEFLKNKGVKMCIATASHKPLIESAFKRLGLLKYFSEIFTCSQIGVGKSNALIYEIAQEHLGSAREHIVVFEDALYAIETAKKAGFITIGVFDKQEKNQKEMKEIADFYIQDFSEFKTVCGAFSY